MDSEDFHFKFKIVVLGDKHVGKSSQIDAIAMNYGKILEIEVSEEYIIFIILKDFHSKQLHTWKKASFITYSIGKFLGILKT